MRNLFHTTLAALSLGIALALPLSHRITRRTQAMGDGRCFGNRIAARPMC
jgi:hypothetical protein